MSIIFSFKYGTTQGHNIFGPYHLWY